MADNIPIMVLDSFALLAYFEAERGGVHVRELFEQARDDRIKLALSLINAGEVYYITYREKSARRALEILDDLHALPIQLYDATEERILNAAKVKATHSISYADAFAVALAQELDGKLVTGDPEFRALESVVKIMWLPSNTVQK